MVSADPSTRQSLLTLALLAAVTTPCLAEDKSEPTPVYKALQPMQIDGRHDEACWQRAVAVSADFPFGAKAKADEPRTMTVKYAWDEHCLYIAYEVLDSDLTAVASGGESGPADNRRPTSLEWAPEKNLDLAEFFVSLGSLRYFWEVHQSAANHLNNHWCAVPDRDDPIVDSGLSLNGVLVMRNEYIADDRHCRVASAVTLLPRKDGSSSTVNDSSDVDTGYRGEIRLPWSGLGAPKQKRGEAGWNLAGHELRMLAVALNGNGGEANYRSSGKDLPRQMFHFSSALWPRFVLVEKP